MPRASHREVEGVAGDLWRCVVSWVMYMQCWIEDVPVGRCFLCWLYEYWEKMVSKYWRGRCVGVLPKSCTSSGLMILYEYQSCLYEYGTRCLRQGEACMSIKIGIDLGLQDGSTAS